MALYTIDHVEGDWVILEDETARAFNVPKAWLPESLREGDVVRFQIDQGSSTGSTLLHVSIAPEERAERLRSSKERRARIPAGPKGDVSL